MSEARILAAAEQIFAETGFSGATTAMIAAKARLPKANLHYYFGTKRRLYRAVLQRILDAWLASGDGIRPEADPATAFADYIAAKIEASRRRPYASKVFANEILHGAPEVEDYLRAQVHHWVAQREAWRGCASNSSIFFLRLSGSLLATKARTSFGVGNVAMVSIMTRRRNSVSLLSSAGTMFNSRSRPKISRSR